MTTGELTTVCHRYLQCLNERRWNGLGEFVGDELSYNGKPMTLGEYRAMLEADTRAIPDLWFTADLVVIEAEIVACRLLFRCTPQQTFLGFEPTGALISFSEHVFYRFRDRQIAEVWSLIDTPAIAAQTAG